MARKSKSVAKHQIIEIAASLKAKAAVPITVSLEQTISELAPQIQAMLDAGYTYADVAEVFKSHGIELAASTIKSYHRKQIQSEQLLSTGQISSVPVADQQSNSEQVSRLSAHEDSDDLEIDPSPDGLAPSVPIPNQKQAKNSLPQPAQVNSKFNVTDRSKL